MSSVINDLATKFSFIGSVKPLNEYNQSLGGSLKLLAGMTLALEGAAAGFSIWANGVLTGVDALNALSRQSKVAVERIQELNFIAGQTQSDSAAIESTIRSLSSTIGQAAQKGSEDFARLGISVRGANGQVKNADVILDEVRQRFVSLGLSVQEQEHFASALGIDTSLIQMLNKTNGEMASLRNRARELGVVTQEQTEQAAEYKQSLNAMWFSLNSIQQLVAVGVAPEMGRLAEEFTQLLTENKDWVINGIKVTVEWTGNLLAAFNRLLPVIGLIIVGFVAWKIAALGLGTVLGVIFSPVVLITAGIAALLVIVDDLIVAFSGGQSVIADFFKDTFDVDIVQVLTGAFDHLSGSLKIAVGWFKQLWQWYSQFTDALVSGGLELIRSVSDFVGFGDDDQQTSSAGNIPMGAITNNGATIDNRQVSQSNSITIVTDDPQAAGRAVEDSLQRQLDNANTQLSVGGR